MLQNHSCCRAKNPLSLDDGLSIPKSTIANAVEQQFAEKGLYISLDGDNIRHGLNKDLGFTEVDRTENIQNW